MPDTPHDRTPDRGAGIPLTRTNPVWVATLTGLVALVVGILVGLRGYTHTAALWGLPFWQVTYHSGFIRRGLVGTLFQGLFGGLSDARQATLVVTIAYGLLLALIIAMAVWLALLADSAPSRVQALALGLLALPIIGSSLFPTMAFTPGYLDSVLLLFAIASAALLARGQLWAAGCLAAIAPFVHEMFVYLWVPLAVFGYFVARRRQHQRPPWATLVSLALPFIAGLVAVGASSASAAQRQIALHVTGTASFKVTLLRQQFGQTLSSALARMGDIQSAYWWPTEPFAMVYFCWPAVLAVALYMVWRRDLLDRWARTALVLAVVCPWLLLVLAWDLSRLLVLANAMVLIVIFGIESQFVTEPLPQIQRTSLVILAAAGILEIALPFLYANFDLYNTYHRNNSPVPYDLMPLVRPALAHMFHLH
jgi:hypothetical protein